MSLRGSAVGVALSLAFAGAGALASSACGSSTHGATSATRTETSLDPPDAVAPTAPACAVARGSVGNVRLAPDFVPQPRCLVIRHDQRLSVTNATGATLTATLGTHLRASIPDGTTYTFSGSVGDYLAPGVHRLGFTPSSGADVWVDAVCRGPEGSDCTTP